MSMNGGAEKSWILKRHIEVAFEHGYFIKGSDGVIYTPEEFCDAIRGKIVKPSDYSVVDPLLLIEKGKQKIYEMMDRQTRFERKVKEYRDKRFRSGPAQKRH